MNWFYVRTQRATPSRPTGPNVATVSAGTLSASTGNRGVGRREQSRQVANQRPRSIGKDGSNIQERSACPPVPENPVTQAQPPEDRCKAKAPDTGPAHADQR